MTEPASPVSLSVPLDFAEERSDTPRPPETMPVPPPSPESPPRTIAALTTPTPMRAPAPMAPVAVKAIREAPQPEPAAEPTEEAAPARVCKPRTDGDISLIEGAYFASLAYQHPYVVDDAYHGSGEPEFVSILEAAVDVPVYHFDQNTGAQGYSVVLKDVLDQLHTVLFCTGTDSLQDVICDLDIDLVPFVKSPSCPEDETTMDTCVKVHAGILRQYEGLEHQIRPCIDEAMQTATTLTCIGHSLGCLVSMTALTFAATYRDKVRYIGYGSPKVGNAAFCKLFKERLADPRQYTLVRNGADPICTLWVSQEYQHICDFHHCGAIDLRPNLPNLMHMPDHLLDSYIKNLQHDDATEPSLFQNLVRCITTIFDWIF